MNTLLWTIVLYLTISNLLHWKILFSHRKEMNSIWDQIRELASNTAKQLMAIKFGKNGQEKTKK